MSSQHIFATAALAACALVACGAPAERRVATRTPASGLPAVSAAAAQDAGLPRKLPGALAELPAPPDPGPALLEPDAPTGPPVDRGVFVGRPRSGETAAPHIVLDAADDDLGLAILGTGLERERLAPSEPTEEPDAPEELGAVVQPLVPASFEE